MRLDRLFKSRQISFLFLFNVLLQQAPDFFDLGKILRILGFEVLEDLE